MAQESADLIIPQTGASTSDSAEGDGDDRGTEEVATTPWLVCAHCRLPIVSQAELIEERFASWSATVYAYQLEVLDRDTCCYSATNSYDHRFDVARTLPSVIGRSIACWRRPTPEYSWFPGFSWSMAHCALCHSHLGWAFCPDAPSTSASQEAAQNADGGRPDEVEMGSAGEAAEEEDMARTPSQGESQDVGSATRDRTTDEAQTNPTSEQVGVQLHLHADNHADVLHEAAEETEEAEEDDEDDDNEVDDDRDHLQMSWQFVFCGLVLTKMREQDLTATEEAQRFEQLRRRTELIALRQVEAMERATAQRRRLTPEIVADRPSDTAPRDENAIAEDDDDELGAPTVDDQQETAVADRPGEPDAAAMAD